MQAIVSGLEPGDPVVLEGIDRLREGRDVVVVENQPSAGPGPLTSPGRSSCGRLPPAC
jgi:hypothetical protein